MEFAPYRAFVEKVESDIFIYISKICRFWKWISEKKVKDFLILVSKTIMHHSSLLSNYKNGGSSEYNA